MPRRILNVAKVKISRLSVVEEVMPLLLFFWTSWFSYFNVISNSEGYRNARFLPDYVWSIIFLIIGMAQALIIFRGNPSERKIILYILSIFWLLWAFMILSANFSSAGFVTYCMIAVMCFRTARRKI